MTQLRAQDISWNSYLPLSFLFLNIGPILLFIPFGLKKLIRFKTPIVYLLLLSTILSYVFYYTPISTYFGTHNLRLFSLTNCITFGILTILGIETVVKFFHLNTTIFTSIIVGILMIIFSVFNYDTLTLRLQDKDFRTPVVRIRYLPDDLLKTFSFLNKQTDNGCILTDPYNSLGMVLPVYIERKSCLGKPIYTPNFEQKQQQADLFLKGQSDEFQVIEFLNHNDIGYILTTSIDRYQNLDLDKYPFLQMIYSNSHSAVFKYNNPGFSKPLFLKN